MWWKQAPDPTEKHREPRVPKKQPETSRARLGVVWWDMVRFSGNLAIKNADEWGWFARNKYVKKGDLIDGNPWKPHDKHFAHQSRENSELHQG